MNKYYSLLQQFYEVPRDGEYVIPTKSVFLVQWIYWFFKSHGRVSSVRSVTDTSAEVPTFSAPSRGLHWLKWLSKSPDTYTYIYLHTYIHINVIHSYMLIYTNRLFLLNSNFSQAWVGHTNTLVVSIDSFLWPCQSTCFFLQLLFRWKQWLSLSTTNWVFICPSSRSRTSSYRFVPQELT